MFRHGHQDPRPSDLPPTERVGLLKDWPLGPEFIPNWTARDIYLYQNALLADPASSPNEPLDSAEAMVYLMGWRAGRLGMSAKLRPWSLQADLDLFRYSNYVGGLIDGIADAAQGTDRVPADVRRLYPDYHQLDVGA